MRKCMLTAAIVCLVGVLTVAVVVAAASGPPAHDSYIDVNEPSITHDSMDLAVEGSESSCTETRTTYLQWDLSDIPGGETVGSAELTLTARFVSGTSSATLALHQTMDGWNESTLTANNAPAVGTQIETQAAPTSAGQTVTFNSAALASYIDAQAAGDDVVSFALLFSSGCPAGGAALVLFEDEESADDVDPDLQLQNPTAVTLASFAATAGDAEALLQWETATEFDTTGFILYRARTEAGPYTQINDALIPAQGDGVNGASYSYIDAPGHGIFYYKLEDVQYGGSSTFYGVYADSRGNPLAQKANLD